MATVCSTSESKAISEPVINDKEAKLIAEADVKGGVASVSYTYICDLNSRLWSGGTL